MAKSIEKRASELIAFAQEKKSQCASWVELSNLIFGPGGPAMQLFPDREDRSKWVKSDSFAELQAIIDSLPEGKVRETPSREDCNGKILVRLPKSIHAALLQEAELEDISLNQLILSKLCVQLKALV